MDIRAKMLVWCVASLFSSLEVKSWVGAPVVTVPANQCEGRLLPT